LGEKGGRGWGKKSFTKYKLYNEKSFGKLLTRGLDRTGRKLSERGKKVSEQRKRRLSKEGSKEEKRKDFWGNRISKKSENDNCDECQEKAK